MRVLALDISTSAGWALLEGERGVLPTVVETGLVKNPQPVRDYGSYPFSYYRAAASVAAGLGTVVNAAGNLSLDAVVIEETNLGRSRYVQKLLEFTHFAFLGLAEQLGIGGKVVYVNTGDWRRTLGLQLSRDDKRNNARVRRARQTGDRASLKALGIRGRIGKKHLALRYVAENFGLKLKVKDDDIADAICLGTAYFLGAPACDGA